MKTGFLGFSLRIALGAWVTSAIPFHFTQAASPSSVPIGGTIVVPMPCSAPAAGVPQFSPFRSCDKVLNGAPQTPASATSPGAPAVPGMLTVLYQRIWQQSDCAYKGIDLDPTKSPNPGQCGGDPLGKVCSLVPLPFYKTGPETTNDHNGQSCGAPVKINVKAANCATPVSPAEQTVEQLLVTKYGITGGEAQLESMSAGQLTTLYNNIYKDNPSAVNATSGSKSNCIYINTTYPNGEREMAWMRGAFMQDLTYQMNGVLNELSCSHQLSILNDPSVNGCSQFATDVLAQYNSTKTIADKLGQMLGAQAAVADVDYCRADWDPHPSNAGVDPGQLRQVATHLCAARAYLENMYAQLVTCDVIAKTRYDFDQKIGLTAAQQNVYVIGKVGQNQIRPLCSQCKNSGSYSSATKCTQACWERNIASVLGQDLQALWPLGSANSCSSPAPGGTPYSFPPQGSIQSPTQLPAEPTRQSSDASSFLGLGFAAGSLSMRRRKKQTKTRERARTVFLASMLILMAAASGCSKAQNLPQVAANDPNNTCPGKPAACCTLNPPPTCPTDSPGLGALTGALTSGAAFAGNSAGENGLASTFSSGSNTAGTGFSNGQAATAGGTGDLSQGAGSGSGSGSGASGVASSGLQQASSGGGAGSGSSGASGTGGGVGSAGLGGSLATTADPNAISTGPIDAELKVKDGAGAQGYTAGSGGGANGGGGGSGFLYGNGLMAQNGGYGAGGVDGAGAGGLKAYGGNGQDVSPMGGSDPANYFSLIGIDESIFKKVETRYRETTMNWAAARAGVPMVVGAPTKR